MNQCKLRQTASTVVNLTLLYINSKTVIPANTLEGTGAGIHPQKHWIPGQARNDN